MHQRNLSWECESIGPQCIYVIRKRIPRASIRKVLLVIEVQIRLPDHHDTFRSNVCRISEAFLKPLDVCRLPRNFFRTLAGDLRVRACFTIDAGVRVVIIRALDVQSEIDDRAEFPAHILRVFNGLASKRERLLTKALRRGGKEVTLKSQALEWIRIRQGVRSIPAPAVCPIIIAGDPDQGILEPAEICKSGQVEVVRTRTITACFEVPVINGKCNMTGIDICE